MKRVKRIQTSKRGSVLVLVLIAIIILTASGVGLLTVSYGIRHQAIKTKNEAVAILAAEAGYERAIFRMSQQPDLLTALSGDDFVSSENLTFLKPDEPGYEEEGEEQTGEADYTISLSSFIGSRPVYKITSVGRCGVFERTVEAYVIQAISGWDMGMCRIPTGTASTSPVYYITNEIIDMPIHINSYGDPYDSDRDIHISGSPDFQNEVTLSESQYSSGEMDKYSSVIHLFDEGIYFLQPSSKIMDRDVVQQKIDSFKATLQSQKPQFIFEPEDDDSVTNNMPAVQIEFFLDGDVGKVRITNNCTVRGGDDGSYDYRIDNDYESLRFEKYDIYGFHYISENAETNGDRETHDVLDTYVTPSYAGVEGNPGGQIFVDGNVIIGGNKTIHSGAQIVKGRISIVATGNIWIADTVKVDGAHDGDGVPSVDNPNILGLIAQGVIKVVDPGKVEDYASGGWTWVQTGFWPWQGYWEYQDPGLPEVSGQVYEPVCNRESGGEVYEVYLPQSVEVEASLTVAGGGWGAENVGGRKDYGLNDNYIIVRGGITEVVRGVVGSGSNGFKKRYYLDERILEGILPGDIWLKGKYIPAPAGWNDYRAQN